MTLTMFAEVLGRWRRLRRETSQPVSTQPGLRPRAALYTWSRGDDAEKRAEDLDAQEERLRSYARKQGYEVIYVFREVGADPEAGRPELKRLRTVIWRRDTDTVVATRPDRLYVDPDRLLHFVSDARLLGVRIEFLEMPADIERMLMTGEPE